jgi:uncharacterized repeat protein (TIGR03803 family)
LLYSFANDSNGSDPEAPPTQGADGNWYGTTTASFEGSQGFGTLYKITASGQFTTLYQFTDGADGARPRAPMIQATDGNFYGTTYSGACGTVFRVTASGAYTALTAAPGCYPAAPLVQGSDGAFYGTSTLGGTYNNGLVFKMSPTGQTRVLHNFNATDGSQPFAGLVEATDGNFYGATWYGGTMGFGTIYRISSTGEFSVLYNFDGSTGQLAGVTPFQHTNGMLYGETTRVVAMTGGFSTAWI